MRRRGAAHDGGFDDVASVVERLAVLVDAGLAPLSAWRHASGRSGAPAVAAMVSERSTSTLDIPEVLLRVAGEGSPRQLAGWRTVAAAWTVSTESGAALAGTLTRAARVLRDLADAERDVEAELAGPTASGRIVLMLPFIGILFSLAVGVDTITVLSTTPAGWACLVIGLGLVALGRLWTRRLVSRARTRDATPGLALDLTAIAVSGGSSLARARALVVRALAESAIEIGLSRVDDVLAFAREAGAPVGALLRAEAEAERRAARSEARRRAGALGVQLMLPLGACVLPSFLALGVVPVVIALLSSTVVGVEPPDAGLR